MRGISSDYLRKLPEWRKLRSRAGSIIGPSNSRILRTENLSAKPTYLHPEVNYLTKDEKFDLIKNRIEPARLKYKQAKSQAEKHKIIQDYFGEAVGRPYLSHPVFKQFVIDSEKGDYYQTRALLSKLKPNFVIGVFQTPWSPELKTESLEGMTFDEEDYGLKEQYPSHAIAIKNVRLSSGFTNEIFVALFPENFVVKNEELRKGSDFDAYYIVDNFVNRYHKYTKKIIAAHAPEVFPSLKNISEEDLQLAIATWLSAHEHFHTTGPLPRVYRPEANEAPTRVNKNKDYGFYLKNSKESGAFEEMRVDLNTLVRLGKLEGYRTAGGNNADFIREFILAERLLRYIAQKDPYDHFDSTVQLVLTNHLIKDGVLTIDDKNQFKLADFSKVTNSLENLLNQVNALETKISQEKDLSKLEDFDAAEEMICRFMRDRSRPTGSFIADDTKLLRQYNYVKAKFKANIRLAEQKKNKKKQTELRKTFAEKTLQPYFERFYPLMPFHLALRETLKPYLPKEKKYLAVAEIKPVIEKKNPEPLTTTTLHEASQSDSKNPIKPPEIIITNSRDDLENIANLPEHASREELDKAFVECLKKQQQARFEPRSVTGTLQTMAGQSPSDFVANDMKKKQLLLFANADEKNRLDEETLKKYHALLSELFKNQVDELEHSSAEQKIFISQVKRILRQMLRVAMKNTEDKKTLLTTLKSWQSEIQAIKAHEKAMQAKERAIKAHKQTAKNLTSLGIVCIVGLLGLAFSFNENFERQKIADRHKAELDKMKAEAAKTPAWQQPLLSDKFALGATKLGDLSKKNLGPHNTPFFNKIKNLLSKEPLSKIINPLEENINSDDINIDVPIAPGDFIRLAQRNGTFSVTFRREAFHQIVKLALRQPQATEKELIELISDLVKADPSYQSRLEFINKLRRKSPK